MRYLRLTGVAVAVAVAVTVAGMRLLSRLLFFFSNLLHDQRCSVNEE